MSRRRRGKRRSAQTEHRRNEARFERTIRAKQKYADALRRKAMLIRRIREQDELREARHKSSLRREAERKRQRRIAEYEEFDRSIRSTSKKKPKVAARSARSKNAPGGNFRVIKMRRNPVELAALNRRRAVTRNKWGSDPCVDKPDSTKAGQESARVRKEGRDRPRYKQRRWC